MELVNLQIQRVILHEVFKRNLAGEKIDPACSDEVENLDGEALNALKDRVITAMTSATRGIQMDIRKVTDADMPVRASALLDSDMALFVQRSKEVAHKLADEQRTRSLPGGVLVVFSGTFGAPARRCLGVIKAEVYNGFMRDRTDDDPIPKMRFLKSLMLTQQTKLYKVGLFCEPLNVADAGAFPAGWEAFVYDDLLTIANRYGAAKYFYEGFLGLGFPESSARITKQFHDLTKTFIQALNRPEEDKVVLHNALVTYLKADQTPTVGITSFGQTYFGEQEIQDAYREFMTGKGFTLNAVNKDIADLTGALKQRRLVFGVNRVRIIGPASGFEKLVSVEQIDGEPDPDTGITPKWSKVIIKDKLTGQE